MSDIPIPEGATEMVMQTTATVRLTKAQQERWDRGEGRYQTDWSVVDGMLSVTTGIFVVPGRPGTKRR